MVTVPDNLNRQNTRIILDLHKPIQRASDLLVLLVDIVGSDLPVGVTLRQVGLVYPCAPLVSEIPVHIISGPADDNQDRKSGSIQQSILSLHLVNQLPNHVVDRTQPLPPFESGVHRADLPDGVVLGLQELSKRQPGTKLRIVMVCNQSK